MSALEFNRPRRRLVPGRGFFVVVFIAVLVAAGYFVVPRFEWRRPEIKITPESETIGLGAIEISVTEQGSGLKVLFRSLVVGRHRLPSRERAI